MIQSLKRDPRPEVLVVGDYHGSHILDDSFHIHRPERGPPPPDVVTRAGWNVRAVVTRADVGLDRASIKALPGLEIIACYGVGTDAIDLDAARARGVQVTNTPDVLTGDVADLAVGLALAVVRAIPSGDAHVRSGAWVRGPMRLAARLHGKNVGIVGLGNIGRAVARRLEGFDVEIGTFTRSAGGTGTYRRFPELAALATWADLLIVTVAGGPETRGLIDPDVLRALGRNGFLVNVSRGSTVDEAALLAALTTGEIAGAALDVFLNEPSVDPRFLALSNVVLQPHQGSATVESREAMGRLVRDNLEAHFDGRPLLTPVRW